MTAIDGPENLSLFTGGEKRWGMTTDLWNKFILQLANPKQPRSRYFIRAGKRAHPKKTHTKEVKCAIQNKVSRKGPRKKRKNV